MGKSKKRFKKSSVILSIVSNSSNDGSIVDLDREHLQYRAEGNANLVLAIPHMKQVLRLGKSVQSNNDHPSVEHVIMVTEYGRIMSSLFAAELTIEPKLVLLRIPSYDGLNNWLNQFRPTVRCDKEIKCRAGILYPDLAILRSDLLPENMQVKGETFCVEIKPKQGWIFAKDTLEALFPDSDDKLCRFCAMQYLKLVRQTIKRVSNYCPIDLFSGDRARMLKALRGLVDTPQNNFRMWRSGQLIYGDGLDTANFQDTLEDIMCQRDHSKNLEGFLELLLEAVLKNDYTGINVPNGDHSRLPNGCVLKQILDAQLLVRDHLQLAAETSEAVDNELSFCNIEKIVEKWSKGKSLATLEGEERYFLGATALDCSLMVTFQKVEEVCSSVIRVADQNFIVSMTVMDLDPKADSHPIKYIKQTKMSYKAHRDFLKGTS